MFKLGVTGSIGAGKSTVANRLAELGARVSNSDELAKSILFNDREIRQALIQRFGSDIVTSSGEPNRQRIAEVAFQTRESQQFLNHLIHPKVRIATRHRLEAARTAGCRLFVVDAPLIFEAGLDKELDAVLVVVAPNDLRKARVRSRSGISSADFLVRDALQWDQEKKSAAADFLIRNDASLQNLIQQVDAIFNQLPI